MNICGVMIANKDIFFLYDYIFVCIVEGEDHSEVGIKTGKHDEVFYWDLDNLVWNIPHFSIEIMEPGNSYSVLFR